MEREANRVYPDPEPITPSLYNIWKGSYKTPRPRGKKKLAPGVMSLTLTHGDDQPLSHQESEDPESYRDLDDRTTLLEPYHQVKGWRPWSRRVVD